MKVDGSVLLRNVTTPGPNCAAPGCDRPLPWAGTGRPARFCSPACRVRFHRAATKDKAEPVSVEVDLGSASSRGRPIECAWLVRLRRGQRSVIVAIGLRRPAADRLAEQIADLLGCRGSRLAEQIGLANPAASLITGDGRPRKIFTKPLTSKQRGLVLCDFPLRIRRFSATHKSAFGALRAVPKSSVFSAPPRVRAALGSARAVHVVLDEQHRRATKHKRME